MAYENILTETAEHICTITINRPKQLNALNKQTIQELSGALREAEADKAVRLIILTGSGEKSFVAGADIKEFADFNVEEGTALASNGQRQLFDKVEQLSKPVIAAVNGFALGGGLELAMSCHMRLASNNARLGLPETSLGLIPGYGGTQRLAQLVGKGVANEMIMSAQMIDAARAEALGLVNYVTEPDALMDTTKALAKKIVRNSSQAIKSAIKSVNAGFTDGTNGYHIEIEEFGKCFGTTDFVEGTTAFLEKRKPSFD
jgi:enoyl-CoA hydratase